MRAAVTPRTEKHPRSFVVLVFRDLAFFLAARRLVSASCTTVDLQLNRPTCISCAVIAVSCAAPPVAISANPILYRQLTAPLDNDLFLFSSWCQ